MEKQCRHAPREPCLFALTRNYSRKGVRTLPGKVAKAYGTTDIMERHRHRFEFNNEYRAQFEAAGMHCVGENPEAHLVEVVELEGKKWYIGTQYHPEYSSTVLNPHPLFMDFVRVAIENKKNK